MAPQAGSQTVGVIPPPPGVTPNFENPEYRSGGIVPLACVFLPLVAIFMALRIYTKVRIIKVFGLEDFAILLFYLRLNPDRGFRTAVYVSLFLTTSYVVALSLAILFACDPVAKFWDPFLEGTCIETTKLYLANAILNVLFDFVVLLVPVPMLRKLQVSTRQKLVIGALFSLGSVTCVVSVVRIYYQETVLGEPDLSWHIVTPTSLVFVECNLSIICGCVMVLRPFLRRHFPKVLGGDYRRYRSPAGLQGAYDGPHGPGSKSEYKTKVSAR
ncbi:MAG: hypothetical protein Q9216_007162, partial [Gyalolechia sp. 2 TL-2023]